MLACCSAGCRTSAAVRVKWQQVVWVVGKNYKLDWNTEQKRAFELITENVQASRYELEWLPSLWYNNWIISIRIHKLYVLH
jgi:hypothetical protein